MSSDLIIGWKEWVSLPNLNIPAIKVKIDTGAKSSSLHAENIDFKIIGNESLIVFDVFPFKNSQPLIKCHEELKDERIVKSSSGDKEQRPYIHTDIVLGGKKWSIELNLTNRDYMGSRMILGREALEGHAIVDVSQKYLHGNYTLKQAQALYQQTQNKK